MRFQIGNTWVGEGEPCFIVAELSCNHLGDLERALKMVRIAARCGANAVKLQTDNPDGGITIDCDKDYFKIKSGPWRGKTFYELYKETFTPWEWVPILQEEALNCEIELFSTPSCIEGARFLRSCNMPAYKISSFEITDIPLIEEVTGYGNPIILSDGCASEEDLRKAVMVICKKASIYFPLAVLTCASKYPALSVDFALMDIMRDEDIISGISDHSTGNEITLVAVAFGAKIVERHFTLDRSLGGPDAGFSIEPGEFQSMVEQIRNIEQAMKPKTIPKSQKYCKSIFVTRDIDGGEILTENNIGIIRPGDGLHPKYWHEALGKTATKPLERGEPLKEGDYE